MTEVQNVFANRRVGLVPVFSGVVFGHPLRHVGDELVQPLPRFTSTYAKRSLDGVSNLTLYGFRLVSLCKWVFLFWPEEARVAILQASPFLAELWPQAPNSVHGSVWRATSVFK